MTWHVDKTWNTNVGPLTVAKIVKKFNDPVYYLRVLRRKVMASPAQHTMIYLGHAESLKEAKELLKHWIKEDYK